MKLKISRIFCLFLLLVAAGAFIALNLVMSPEAVTEARLVWMGIIVVGLVYAVLVYKQWANPDRLLILAGGFAVALLWMLSLLGF